MKDSLLNRFLIHYKASYSGLPKSAWMLALVVFVNRSGSMVLFFLVLYLTHKLNYTIAAAGRMISIYGLGSLIGAFLGGWLSDRIGALKVQLSSLILAGFGYIILSFMTAPVPLAMTLFAIAIIAEAFRPANATAFAEICPPGLRSRGFALNRLAANLGVAIGPAIGGFLATISYSYLFWADGLTCLAASICMGLFFAPKGIRYQSKSTISNQPIPSPWWDRPYLFVLFLCLLMGIIFIQILNTWPVYMQTVYGLLEDEIGLLLSLNAVMIVFIEMPLIHSIEKKKSVIPMALGALCLGSGFGILPIGNTYWFAAFTVVLWTFGEMLVFPLIAGFAANRASDQNRGKYMGMYTFTFSLAYVLGPAMGSWIYDQFGATQLWSSAGLLGVLIMTGFLAAEKFKLLSPKR